MAYTPTTFVDDQPPALSASEMNKIGAGIRDAHDAASNALSVANSHPDIRVSETEPTGPSVGTVWISY